MSASLPAHNEDKIRLINKVFGKTPEKILAGLTTEEEVKGVMIKTAVSQLGIIRQEVEEAYDAKTEHDIRDALCDILVTVFGMGYLLGFPRWTPFIKVSMLDGNVHYPVHRTYSIRDLGLAIASDVRTILHTEYPCDSEEGMAAVNKHAMQMLGGHMLQLEKSIDVETNKLDLEELAEACAGLITAAHNVSFIVGCNIDKDMEAVTNALFSRLCDDEGHAERTVSNYNLVEGIDTHYAACDAIPGKFVVYSSKDQYGKSGDHYPENKFLKALGYGQPVFEELYRGDDEPLKTEEEGQQEA